MFNRYRKSISSLVATIAGWGLAASADDSYTQQEWWGLAILLAGVVAVWGIPNDTPAGMTPDPAISERGPVDMDRRMQDGGPVTPHIAPRDAGYTIIQWLMIIALVLVVLFLGTLLFDVDFNGR